MVINQNTINMRKNILYLSIVLLLHSFTLSAQYTLSTFNDPFVPFTNGTSLSNGLTWDDPEYILPIGFDFTFLGLTSNTIYFTELGGGLTIVDDIQNPTLATTFGIIDNDLMDRGVDTNYADFEDQPNGQSDISYILTGSVGNRILKIQWANAGFYSDIVYDNVSRDYFNGQLWIYEADSSIEMRYGPSSVSQPLLSYDSVIGPSVVFGKIDNSNPVLYGLTGSTSAPTIDTLNFNNSQVIYLNNTIPDGTVYRLGPSNPSSSREVVDLGKARIFPNPCTKNLNISGIEINEIKKIEIHNSLGQFVKNYSANVELDIEDLEKGIYTLSIYTEKGIYRNVLTKK